MNERSNQLAHYLVNNLDDAEDYIGVYQDRSVDVYISILAILKTGKAYVPIGFSLPVARVQYIVKDVKLTTILTTHDELELSSSNLKIINVSSLVENHPLHNLDFDISLSSPLYI
ncbi:AMP-binding protein, partial [Aquimarina algiphila]|uniref:AMP-binding protein n=1 Tax=Aquimarina algiphila TaxID=2047982 RepID=UPI00232DD5A2